MTWIFNNTNGSILAAVLFHGMANSVDALFLYSGSEWCYNGVRLLVVILIVVVFGSKNLIRHGNSPFVHGGRRLTESLQESNTG
jgi:hypothetical protein